MKRLAENIIDSEIEGHYAFFPVVEDISTQEHQHDFFEIFLIADGAILHHINDEDILLQTGSLVFIRPNDAHFFNKHEDQSCELINLAFLEQTFRALVDYLGLDLQNASLLTIALPPCVLLNTPQKNQVAAQLRQWGRYMYRDKGLSRLTLRALLARLLSDFFVARFEDFTGNMPQWLKDLCQEMERTENLAEGRTALLRLANRTPEYVGRAFKTHLGITPSKFINDLRLDYASDLLVHTDIPVIEVCHEVGFGNLSHFYHLFKTRWECSPIQFRKKNKQTLVL